MRQDVLVLVGIAIQNPKNDGCDEPRPTRSDTTVFDALLDDAGDFICVPGEGPVDSCPIGVGEHVILPCKQVGRRLMHFHANEIRKARES